MITEPVVMFLRESLNIEVFCVIYLRKTNVSENVWNLLIKNTSLSNIVNLLKNRKKNKNIMTTAKVQPFCKKQIINLGVYNPKQQEILPRSVTERRICLFIHKNHFFVIWKRKKTNFTDAIKELENNFEYQPNHITDNILKQVVEYKFPISNENDCLFAVLSFDLDTVKVPYQEFCEAYAAGCYHLDRLKECYNGDLTQEELEIERQHVH